MLSDLAFFWLCELGQQGFYNESLIFIETLAIARVPRDFILVRTYQSSAKSLVFLDTFAICELQVARTGLVANQIAWFLRDFRISLTSKLEDSIWI